MIAAWVCIGVGVTAGLLVTLIRDLEQREREVWEEDLDVEPEKEENPPDLTTVLDSVFTWPEILEAVNTDTIVGLDTSFGTPERRGGLGPTRVRSRHQERTTVYGARKGGKTFRMAAEVEAHQREQRRRRAEIEREALEQLRRTEHAPGWMVSEFLKDLERLRGRDPRGAEVIAELWKDGLLGDPLTVAAVSDADELVWMGLDRERAERIRAAR